MEIFGLGGEKDWDDDKKKGGGSKELEPYDERAEAAFYALNEVSTVVKTYEEIEDIITRNNNVVVEGGDDGVVVEGFDEIPYSVKEYYKAELRISDIRWELVNNSKLSDKDVDALDLELEGLLLRVNMLKEDIGDAPYRNIEGLRLGDIQERHGEIDNLKRDLMRKIDILKDDMRGRYGKFDKVEFERGKKRQDMLDGYSVNDVRRLMMYDRSLDNIIDDREKIREEIRAVNKEIEVLDNEKEDLGVILELNGVVIEGFEEVVDNDAGIDPLVLDYYDKELRITEASLGEIEINVDELNTLKDDVKNIKKNVIKEFYYINIEGMGVGEINSRYLEVMELIRALRLEIEVQEANIDERNENIDRLKSNKAKKKKVNKEQKKRNNVVDDNERDVARVDELLLEEEHLLAILGLRNVEVVAPEPVDEPVIVPDYIVDYYETQLQIREIQEELGGGGVEEDRRIALEADLSELEADMEEISWRLINQYYIDISVISLDDIEARYYEVNDEIDALEATILLKEDEIDRRNDRIDDLKDDRDDERKKYKKATSPNERREADKKIREYDDKIDKRQKKRKRVRNTTNDHIKEVEALELERGHLIIILNLRDVLESKEDEVVVGNGEEEEADDVVVEPPPDNLQLYYETELAITRTQAEMDEILEYINGASKWTSVKDEEIRLAELEGILADLMDDVDEYKKALRGEFYINVKGMSIDDIMAREMEIIEEINALKEEIDMQEDVIAELEENIDRLKGNNAKKKKVNKEQNRRNDEIVGNNKDIEKLQDLLMEQDHLKIILDMEQVVTPSNEEFIRGELATNYNIVEQELGWMMYNTARVLGMKFDKRLDEVYDLLDEFDSLNIADFEKMIEMKFM
jgi:hypothetical protein